MMMLVVDYMGRSNLTKYLTESCILPWPNVDRNIFIQKNHALYHPTQEIAYKQFQIFLLFSIKPIRHR